MPTIPTGKLIGAHTSAKLCDAVVNGSTLVAALADAGLRYSDHVRMMERDETYKNQIAQALRQRSLMLLERCLDIEAELAGKDAETVTAAHCAAYRLRLDSLKAVAAAYDLSPQEQAARAQNTEGGLIELLKRLDEMEGDCANPTQPLDS